MIATVAAQSVASSAVPTIAVGRVDPEAARIAIAVAGINCTELVLIARNVHIAFVATPGSRIERLEIAHRAQTERRRGVAEAEHVGRHVHQHRTHRRMLGRNVGKKPSHYRTQPARDSLDQPRALGQAHHAEPKRHDRRSEPSAIVTAVFAPSNAPSVTSFKRSFQPPIATASKTSASQM